MAERKNPMRNIRLIVRPGTRKLRIALTLLILLSAVAMVAIGIVAHRIESRTQEVLDQAAALEQENVELTDKTEDLGSNQSIKDIAQEELGLIDPNTVVLDPNS